MYFLLSVYRDRNELVINDLYNSNYVELSVRVTIFAISLYLCYIFCVQYTLFFASLASNNINNFSKSLSTFGFICLIQVFKVICNSFAQAVDLRLSSGQKQYYSMYIISTIQVDIYLITFHRNLFTFLNSWVEFFEIIIGYLVFETFFFTLSISMFYLELHNTLMKYDPRSLNPSIFSTKSSTDNSVTKSMTLEVILVEAYQNFNKNIINEAFVFKNALNITLLFVIKVATSVTYIITLPIIRYSYNKSYFPTTSKCSATDFTRIVLSVFISLIIDIVVFLLADKYVQVYIYAIIYSTHH